MSKLYNYASMGEPPPQATKPSTSPTAKPGNTIDLELLKKQLKTLQDDGQTAWANKNVAGYLKTLSGKESKSISEGVSLLTEAKGIEFLMCLNEALGKVKRATKDIEPEELPF